MLISEIKNKEVRERAKFYARTMPYACEWRRNKQILYEAFYWSETDEGFEFWSAVNNGEEIDLPTTIPAEFDMPRLPAGWCYTREFRKSIKGVDYIYCDGKVVLSRGQELEYPIVVRISE